VARSLDAALGYADGDLRQSVAFFVDLAGDSFLVVGVEISRGGPAIPEDAISFRAYKASENKFALVAHTNVWNVGVGLHAVTLPSAPTKNELWFFASAAVNTQAPPMVSMRLYAFGGSDFRVVWEPTDSQGLVCEKCVLSEGPARVLDITSGGFVVNKLFDPTGQAAHSPSVNDSRTIRCHCFGASKSARNRRSSSSDDAAPRGGLRQRPNPLPA